MNVGSTEQRTPERDTPGTGKRGQRPGKRLTTGCCTHARLTSDRRPFCPDDQGRVMFRAGQQASRVTSCDAVCVQD